MDLTKIRIKITTIINKILPHDKMTHLILGLHLYVLGIACTLTPLTSLIVTGVIGVLIELYQKHTKTGKFEILDSLAVLYGAALPYSITLMHYFPWFR